MKLFKKAIAVFALVCICLCGCEKNRPPLPAMVEKVDVYGNHQGAIVRRHYTDPQKMEKVLNLLRQFPYRGKTTLNPFTLPGDDFSITVSLSGGSRKVYHVQSTGFLCRPGGSWEKSDREVTERLLPILEDTPSDL